ncbi:hypothetical protein PR202_ga09365 [Eleusine coracana subsp. coracana]|uniref:NB-ARC domain-containing protein n=1 Tax=Eleusine coracana subsp. coracana TaxID=191504 RepID=A0AAV5C571_ELECO|nr:hypothetical protein QOZ80_1AG0036600 [Eleusine coracana subsp. coracana]GJM92859.1 hypothetical protein PR202_ga09365 [Eleusine coracana subsp. coracana]
MAVEVVQFLVRKFVDSLDEEAAADELPFSAQFHAVKAELEKASISSANADELRECLYELNDLLTECRMLTDRPSLRGCFAQQPGGWRLTKTKKRMAAVRCRVVQCVQSDNSVGNAAGSQEDGATAVGLQRWTTAWLEENSIHGFEQQLAEVESMAFRDCREGRLNGVGIVGMGGVGKTALAKLLFHSKRVRGSFRPRIWMCMSRTVCAGADVRKEVLQGMIMALGHEEDDILSMDGGDSLADLLFAVHQQLMGKRYLIVFDDVWHVDGWYADVVGSQNNPKRSAADWSERLTFGLPKGRGGMVVVTSRMEQVAAAMVGGSYLHRMRPLTDRESCWKIFINALHKDKRLVDQATADSMKEEILKTCAGLPLAAKTMADIFARSLSSHGSTSTSQELDKSNRIINGNSRNLK